MTLFLNIIRYILEILTFCIFLRAILTWIMPGQTNFLTDTLYHITEPILAPIRSIMPRSSMVDFSPMIAIILFQIIIILLL